jgi:hypothetical protein
MFIVKVEKPVDHPITPNAGRHTITPASPTVISEVLAEQAQRDADLVAQAEDSKRQRVEAAKAAEPMQAKQRRATLLFQMLTAQLFGRNVSTWGEAERRLYEAVEAGWAGYQEEKGSGK